MMSSGIKDVHEFIKADTPFAEIFSPWKRIMLRLMQFSIFMGVSPRMLLGNVVFCVLVCIIAHNLWGMALFIVIHLLAVNLSSKEPDYFSLNMKYYVKTPPVLNRWHCRIY